jgi:hypothetical protein
MKVVLMKLTGVEWERSHVCAKCARAIYKLVEQQTEYGIEKWGK